MKKFTCCICGQVFEGFGNNPDGAVWRDGDKIVMSEFDEDERCCNDCDNLFVIPGRLYRLRQSNK